MHHSTHFRFILLQIFYWAFNASFLGYISPFFLENKISGTRLSLLIAGFMLMAFTGSVFWGSLCDKTDKNRRYFLICGLLGIVLLNLVYFRVRDGWLLNLIYPLLGFTLQPMSSNMDSWLLKTIRNDETAYGKIRSFGSAAYAAAGLLIGQFIAAAGSMIHRLSVRSRYIAATVTPLIMMLLNLGTRSIFPVIIGTCFGNISYGLMLPTMREVTEKNVEELFPCC